MIKFKLFLSLLTILRPNGAASIRVVSGTGSEELIRYKNVNAACDALVNVLMSPQAQGLFNMVNGRARLEVTARIKAKIVKSIFYAPELDNELIKMLRSPAPLTYNSSSAMAHD